ncbi:MAG: hypothetical protein KDN19_01245 [Verrucomicrobiae bacterium]|nr:hypothetical protein [Verrucomicrobiae bacterium]
MAAIVGLMILAMLGALFYLRWRSAHPLPEPDSVRSVVGDSEIEPGKTERSDTWEKSADWWKSEGDDSGDRD